MIKNSQMVLEFGNGDIGVGGGNCKSDHKIGIVVFSNIEKREIGSFKGFDDVKNENYPLVMTFTKKESIDVVIKALQDAKKEMEVV